MSGCARCGTGPVVAGDGCQEAGDRVDVVCAGETAGKVEFQGPTEPDQDAATVGQEKAGPAGEGERIQCRSPGERDPDGSGCAGVGRGSDDWGFGGRCGSGCHGRPFRVAVIS
jgi:hypothetical protein